MSCNAVVDVIKLSMRLLAVLSVALAILAVLWTALRQRALLSAARQRRTATIQSRLRTQRLELDRQHSLAARPKLTLQLQVLGNRCLRRDRP